MSDKISLEQTAANSPTKECPNCHAEVSWTSIYCKNCGRVVP